MSSSARESPSRTSAGTTTAPPSDPVALVCDGAVVVGGADVMACKETTIRRRPRREKRLTPADQRGVTPRVGAFAGRVSAPAYDGRSAYAIRHSSYAQPRSAARPSARAREGVGETD